MVHETKQLSSVMCSMFQLGESWFDIGCTALCTCVNPGEVDCDNTVQCHEHGECYIHADGSSNCRCAAGFKGSGTDCYGKWSSKQTEFVHSQLNSVKRAYSRNYFTSEICLKYFHFIMTRRSDPNFGLYMQSCKE